MRVIRSMALGACLLTGLAQRSFALEGQVNTHDPSTIAICDGKYYVFTTGSNIPSMISDDGWTWRRGTPTIEGIPENVRKLSPKNNGRDVWAPDIKKIGDRYFMYYSVSSWGDFASAVGLLTNTTLDSAKPEYKWVDQGPIVWSDGVEDLNAIDPGIFLDPTNGSLWLTYGSYHGTIRLVQLDPKTGQRLDKDKPAAIIGLRCESSVIIYRDGWYYLIANHGSCCNGATSGYNLRMGRSKVVTGPYIDSFGDDMARGAGDLLLATGDRKIGPGHFGLLDLGDEVQKFSMHYECDVDKGGASVLDIRPLLYRDGWPVAGENLKDGTYQIRSKRTGTIMEAAIPGVPVVQRLGRGGNRGGRGATTGRGATSGPATQLSAAPATLPAPPEPAGPVNLQIAPYLLQAQQKWTIAGVAGAGGTPGAPYFKIVLSSGRSMQANDNGTVNTVPAFTGAENQLWRIDQMTDCTYRISPKGKSLALSTGARNSLVLSAIKAESADQKWEILLP